VMTARATARRALRGWRAHASLARRNMDTARRIMQLAASRGRGVAFGAWRRFAVEQRAHAKIQEQLARLHMARLAAAACAAWHKQMRRMQCMRAVVARMRCNVQARCLRSWAARAAARAQQRTLQGAVAHQLCVRRCAGLQYVAPMPVHRCGVSCLRVLPDAGCTWHCWSGGALPPQQGACVTSLSHTRKWGASAQPSGCWPPGMPACSCATRSSPGCRQRWAIGSWALRAGR
jgi:hypothetical protein